MGVSKNGPRFLKAVNCKGEYKDKFFISIFIKENIGQVRATSIIQVITDDARTCKATGLLIEAAYPHIFKTLCIMHKLNIALKNICATKNTDANEIIYNECHWIQNFLPRMLSS